MKAWKQVDAEHAERVARGCLRIGTLSGYMNLENGRADPIDGGVSLYSSQPLLKGHPPSERAMARMGIEAQLAIGVTVNYLQPPAYAFCMAEPGCTHDPSPQIPKATFEISDAIKLAYAIVRKYPDLFHRLMLGKIAYAPRTFDALTQDPEQADAFVKDVRFQDEQEIRILLTPKNGIAEPFCTDEDPVLAAFFRRIS